MLPLFNSMQQQNWLLQYASINGLENILRHMSKRTSFPAQFDRSIPIIVKEKEEMLPLFNEFFKELCLFSKNHSLLGE
jgi:acyl carrier protein phosphodiesterase